MISRKNRFHGYNSLRYVYRHGQTVRGPLFAIKYVVNPRREEYRLAVVVSRKVAKSAVRRNRIRRRLFEIVRELDSPTNTPHDIVLNVFSETIIETPARELAHQVKKQLRDAGIIAKK